MILLRIDIYTDDDFGWDRNKDDEAIENAEGKVLFFSNRKEAVDFLIEHLKRVTSTFRPAGGRENIQEWYADLLNDVSKVYYSELLNDAILYEYKDFGNQSVRYEMYDVEMVSNNGMFYYTGTSDPEKCICRNW